MKTKLLKLLVVMTISVTALFALGLTASAATAGDFTITLTEGGGDPTVDTDYTYADGVLTIKKETAMTIANTDPNTATTNRIYVEDGVSANITLSGVEIDTSEKGSAAFSIADNSTGDVTITLANGSTNTLKSGFAYAGLQKNGDYSETLGKLTITGTGKLTVTGGEAGAGIGGGYVGSGSNIEISGGTVTATGGQFGAGIGGGAAYGSSAVGCNIKISGGTVNATGGEAGAGIGGGYCGVGSDITISGGSVKAAAGEKYEDSDGATYSPAVIGQGVQYDDVTELYSDGEEVTPTLADKTTPVYPFFFYVDGTSEVTIDGVAYPKSHYNENRIYTYITGERHIVKNGSKEVVYEFFNGAFVTLGTGFVITASNSGDTLIYGTDYIYPNDAGVLTVLSDKAMTIANADPEHSTSNTIVVKKDISANITLSGVDISPSLDTPAFMIEDNSKGNVTITLADDSENKLKGRNNCAGLQKNGDVEGIGKLTIKGGTNGTGKLIATSGREGAGIGGGNNGSCSNITITGGTVEAASGESTGAGIGGGGGGSCSDITITGGTVIAIGSMNGAGIGSGSGGSCTDITITGGVVYAGTYLGGAGIGSGVEGSCSGITITGGTVWATGNYLSEQLPELGGGPGIGSGGNGSCSDIVISGGTVWVEGSESGGDAGTLAAPPIGTGIIVKIDENYNIESASDGTPVIPTLADKTTPVYLLTLDVDGTSEVTINGTAYPKKHLEENKLYVYLPAKTAVDPNVVTIGDKTTKYVYDTTEEEWKTVVTVDDPAADTTEFTYDGTEKTYKLTESENYTITGNKQTNAGTYTVTTTLKDAVAMIWSDGTTAAKTYSFVIAKADPVIAVKTNPVSDIAGKTITVTVTAKNPANDTLTDVPNAALSYKVGANGTETAFTGSFVIPKGTANGTVITVTAKTAASDNYNEATATATVTVTDCKHTDVQTKWTTDSTSHWHICGCCNAEVDKTTHTSDGGKVTTEATATTNGVKTYSCTVCGYVIKTEVIPATGETPVVTTPANTTPAYTGKPSWVTIPTGPITTTTTTTTVPADEDIEDNTEVDENTDTVKPSNKKQPQIKGENGKIGWEAIIDEITDTDDGDTVIVDMNGATEVPEDIFEQIKGQDIDLVIELDNGFTWTINGESVTEPMDIDLGVNEGAAIPVKVINKVTGECEYLAITLTHNGDFGFTATLTVDMGEENKGYYANLYWYTAGDMEFICADKISSKGKADLTFTHASEYIIVIDEESHAKRAEVSEDTDEESDSDVDGDTIIADEDDANPPTGLIISFAGVAVSAMAVVISRKRKNN